MSNSINILSETDREHEINDGTFAQHADHVSRYDPHDLDAINSNRSYEKNLISEMAQERKEHQVKIPVHREAPNKWGGFSQWIAWIDVNDVTQEDRISDGLIEKSVLEQVVAKLSMQKTKVSSKFPKERKSRKK